MPNHKNIRKNGNLLNNQNDLFIKGLHDVLKPNLYNEAKLYLNNHDYKHPTDSQSEHALVYVANKRSEKYTRHNERKLAKEMILDLYAINDPRYVNTIKNHHQLRNSGIALIMYACYHFAYFIDENQPKPIMLMDDPHEPNYQLYTYSEFDVIHEINRIYPQFNIKNISNVMSKIATLVEDDYMLISHVKDKLRNYIHVSNGFVNMSDKDRKLIPFNWRYVTTNKINTKYVTSNNFHKLASLSIKNCLTHTELEQVPEHYDWLLNMTISDFIRFFFNGLANGDSSITIQLWQVILDAIQGNKTRRKAVILLGDGSNGKSMFADLLRDIIGSQNIATLTLSQIGADNSQQNFYLGNLVNKTVDIADDASDGFIMKDSGAFKTIVAGGDLTIAVKNKTNYSTHINMTIIQPCNEMPNVKKISQSIYDRFLIIPFTNRFDIHNSKEIPTDLLESILNSDAIDEYVLYRAVHQPNFNHYYESSASKQALVTYEDYSDKTRAFANHFMTWDIDRIPVKTVYQLYRQYTKEHGNIPENANKFNKEFKQLIRSKYCHKSARYNQKQVNQLTNLDVKLPSFKADAYPKVGSNLRSYVRLQS